MAATYSANHLDSRSEIRLVRYDVDAALNIADLGQPQGGGNSCLPIANFRRFRARLLHNVGVGAVSAFQLVAATSAAGAGATIVAAHALGSVPDAVGDQVGIECDVEQIREVLPTATHVGVRVQMAVATDEGIVFFERADPFYPRAGLTSDYVS